MLMGSVAGLAGVGAALWVLLQIAGAAVGMPETALIGGTMLVIATGARLTFAFTDEIRFLPGRFARCGGRCRWRGALPP